MRRISILRALTILGLGAAGLIGGHALGYAIAIPDVHHRTVALAGTGHGYLPSASWLAVVFGIAALVTGIAAGALHRSRRKHLRYGRVAARLVALQVAAFVTLEIVERLVTGASMASLSLALLSIGLLAQVVVALVLGLVVSGLRRIGERIRDDAVVQAVGGQERVVVSSDLAVFSRSPVRDRVRGPPVAAAA